MVGLVGRRGRAQHAANVVFVLLLVNEDGHLIEILQDLHELFLRAVALGCFHKVRTVSRQNAAQELHQTVSHHVRFEEFVARVDGVVQKLIEDLSTTKFPQNINNETIYEIRNVNIDQNLCYRTNYQTIQSKNTPESNTQQQPALPCPAPQTQRTLSATW